MTNLEFTSTQYQRNRKHYFPISNLVRENDFRRDLYVHSTLLFLNSNYEREADVEEIINKIGVQTRDRRRRYSNVDGEKNKYPHTKEIGKIAIHCKCKEYIHIEAGSFSYYWNYKFISIITECK